MKLDVELDTQHQGVTLAVRPVDHYQYSPAKVCRLTIRDEHGSTSANVSIAELQHALRAILEAR